MKSLVVYYSRTGRTRKLARMIAEALAADTEEIVDDVNRHGFLGYLRSGHDAAWKRATAIRPIEKDPSEYDLVIIGTPVWRASLSSPVRRYFEAHGKALPQVAFFCTRDGGESTRVFEQMKRSCGRSPLATLARTKRQLAKPDLGEVVTTFAWILERAEARARDVLERSSAITVFV